jgi:hypothetical protein
MQEIPLNWIAIIVAAVVRQVIGLIWFSPIVFGPAFVRYTGCSDQEMKKRLPAAIAWDLLGALIMSFILVHAVYYAGATTIGTGIAVGLFNWLGFIVVTHLPLVTYEKRPLGLFAIGMAYNAVSLAVMGAILAVWH